jgi:hypothetical protein
VRFAALRRIAFKPVATYQLYWLAAIGVLALSLFLRLWRLDLVEFKDDQAALLRMAEDMARLGRIPLAGMTSSIGIPLAPSFEYLLAPIVAVSRDPRVATAAIGLANAAAVAGTLVLGWRWFSPLTGLVAGLVFATNPWAVTYSRKVWSNDVLAPTAVLLMFCLDKAVIGEQVGWGIAAFPLFAIGVEFHPSFALLAPLIVVLAVMLVRRGQLMHMALGLGLAGLTAVPYVIYTIQTHARYLDGLASSEAPRMDGAGPGDVVGLIGGWRNWNLEGVDINVLLPWRLATLPGAIGTLLLAIGIVAALVLVFRCKRAEHRLRAAGLLLWVLLPMLLTVRHSIPLYGYYFLFVLPAGALLIGLGVQMLGNVSRVRRAGRVLMGAGLAATLGMASIHSAIVLRQLGYLDDAYVPYYGPPLEAAEQTTHELIGLVNQNGGRELSVEIDDVNDVSIGYLARAYVPEVQVVERRRGPWDVDFDLPNHSDNPPYGLDDPPHLTPPESLDVSYADGVRVISASTTREVAPGESLGLALTWTVDHPSPEPLTRRLVWEMSLYDPSAREVRRVAGLPHDWAQLDAGEVVVSWIPVATSPEAAEGVYQVHVNRLDPRSRKPVAPIAAEAEWGSGSVEVSRS